MIRLLADENIAGLEALPASSVCVSSMAGRSIGAEDLDGIDALWVRSVTRVDKSLLSKANVAFVGTATAGTEHVDQEYLKASGIRFSAAPGSNANAVVEYVLAALLALDEPWQKLERGASLGIVGYGHVGKRLKSVADRMGWSVKVYDPPVAARLGSERKHSFAFCSLEELLESEIISVHCSLTYGAPNPSFCLFDESVFSCLDSSQTVINASRGEVFDWSALRKHLASSNPVNLVVDVWENEPKVDPELLDDQAIKLATPHIAGYSLDAKLEATRMLWQGMADIGLVSPISLHFDHDLAQRSKELTSPVRSSKELLERHYRIREDDRKMRGLLRATREDVDLSFDELRRNYPLRREVAKLEQLPVDEEARLLIKKDVARLLEALTQSA